MMVLPLQKIQIRSNNISYGPPPLPEDEVEQRLTINAKGQVWFSGYCYGNGFGSENYVLSRKMRVRISQENAKELLRLISLFLNSNLEDMLVTDIGTWDMSVTDYDKNKYTLIGSLCGGVIADGVDLSKAIRSVIPIKGLFAFDGGNDEGDLIRSAILGLCIGDALGVPVEFQSRQSLAFDPVESMRGYGTYNMPIGTWSDDTSLTLCLLDSLSNGLDYEDIMSKFVSWYKEGSYTQYGEAFDIGTGTKAAIQRYLNGTAPLECGGKSEFDNGNGSLMRILPLLFYLRSEFGAHFYDFNEAFNVTHNVSALTHGHPRSQLACGIYLTVASMIMDGMALREAISDGIKKAMTFYAKDESFGQELGAFERLKSDTFKNLEEFEIRSSGYVVDTLEAALWCLLNTSSYKECVLKAVNLGNDTDTIAAVAGGLAGLYYGGDQIPVEWVDAIPSIEIIDELVGC